MVQEIDKNGNLENNNFVLPIFFQGMGPSPYGAREVFRSLEEFSPKPEEWQGFDVEQKIRCVAEGVARATQFIRRNYEGDLFINPIIIRPSPSGESPYNRFADTSWARNVVKLCNRMRDSISTRGIVLPHALKTEGEEPTIYGVHPDKDLGITIEKLRSVLLAQLNTLGITEEGACKSLAEYAYRREPLYKRKINPKRFGGAKRRSWLS